LSCTKSLMVLWTNSSFSGSSVAVVPSSKITGASFRMARVGGEGRAVEILSFASVRTRLFRLQCYRQGLEDESDCVRIRGRNGWAVKVPYLFVNHRLLRIGAGMGRRQFPVCSCLSSSMSLENHGRGTIFLRVCMEVS
jgi:hypothetical protein